jgi:hypothetical protein
MIKELIEESERKNGKREVNVNWNKKGWIGLPKKGCHHKAVVQCQGQRAGREQARRDLQASNISE